MTILHIERIGGLAGFGGAHTRIRSRGQIDTSELSDTERQAVDSLFRNRGAPEAPKIADGFRFRITQGTKTVVVSEAVVPAKVAACVQDEFI